MFLIVLISSFAFSNGGLAVYSSRLQRWYYNDKVTQILCIMPFILHLNSITIMETRKFKIGTVTTRLTLKGSSKEHSHYQIHGLSRGTSFYYWQDLGYTTGIANVARINRKCTRSSGNKRMRKEKEKERFKFYVLM